MKVVAFRAPKQDADTMSARTREPMGPKTTLPNLTAIVFEDSIVAVGRTNMYAMFARR